MLLHRLELLIAGCLHLMECGSHILAHAGIPLLVDCGRRKRFDRIQIPLRRALNGCGSREAPALHVRALHWRCDLDFRAVDERSHDFLHRSSIALIGNANSSNVRISPTLQPVSSQFRRFLLVMLCDRVPKRLRIRQYLDHFDIGVEVWNGDVQQESVCGVDADI